MKAFTIIELVITLVVIGILVWVGIAAMFCGTDGYIFFAQRKEMLADARMSLDRMSREIRMVKNITSITTATQTTFSFIDTSDKNITFSISSGVINRIEDGVTNSLLGDVDSLTFTYYNAGDSVIASPIVSPAETDIRRIKISITISKEQGRTLNLQSDITPRNLKVI